MVDGIFGDTEEVDVRVARVELVAEDVLAPVAVLRVTVAGQLEQALDTVRGVSDDASPALLLDLGDSFDAMSRVSGDSGPSFLLDVSNGLNATDRGLGDSLDTVRCVGNDASPALFLNLGNVFDACS